MAAFRFKSKTEQEKAEAELQAETDFEADDLLRRESMFAPERGLLLTRKHFGKTQSEMAEIAGISRRAYQNYEGGKIAIPSTVLVKICARFELDMHKLFTGIPFPIPAAAKVSAAKAGIEICSEVYERFKPSGISATEAMRITFQAIKWHDPGQKIDPCDIDAAVRIVTGDKWLPDWNYDDEA